MSLLRKSALLNIELNQKQQNLANVENPISDELSDVILKNPVQFIFKYLNERVLDSAIDKNPEISNLLSEYHLDLHYEIDNVSSIIASHLIPTSRLASKMYLNMGHKKEDSSYLILIAASLLHDIGKIFIPKSILNKASKLNSHEREIIEIHNKLSYEILKTTHLGLNIAKLAYEHHNYEKNIKRNPLNQTLIISDIYSALKENRPYRKALDDLRAKTIMFDMGTSGFFDVGYLKYLF